MSTPFWIFIAVLGVLCVWALISQHLISQRFAGHAKAEEALNTRMLVFRERVRNREARLLAEETAARKETDELSDIFSKYYEPDHRSERFTSSFRVPPHRSIYAKGSLAEAEYYTPAIRSRLSRLQASADEEYEVAYFAKRAGITPEQARELITKGTKALETITRKSRRTGE